MAAYEDQRRTISAQTTLTITPERLWKLVGSAERFFALQPRFAGLTPINGNGLAEGSRYVIHRSHDGMIFDRVGEVLVSIRERQLTVSDLDIADPSVSGHFPSMFTLLIEPVGDDPGRSNVRIFFSTVGVLPSLIPAVLLLQLRNLQELTEEETF
jgi:hypothetical protein